MTTRTRTTTPKRITPVIEALASELVPGGVPVFLPATPPAPDAQMNECFAAVEGEVTRHGGSACIGWRIWEWPHVLIEAEFHAVWRNPAGELCDVTPLVNGEARILFLPDPGRAFEGKQVNSIRKPLSTNPDVAAFIAVADAEFELGNRGERDRQGGQITLEGDEAEEWIALQRKRRELLPRLLKVSPPGRNEACDCGSGRKFKHCCGSQ